MRRHRSLDSQTVEHLLAGRCPEGREDLEALAELTSTLRSVRRAEQPPKMRGELLAFVEAPLTDKGDQPATAGSNAYGPVLIAQVAGLPKWRAQIRRKRTSMVNALSAFVATVAGKIVLGTAVAAAGVGGLHAANVVDVPGLPGGQGSSTVEEHRPDVTPGGTGDPDGVGTAGHENGGEGHGPSDDPAPGDFGSRVSDDATGESDGEPGVDGSEISEEADDFGISTAKQNAPDGTPIPDDPTSGAGAGSQNAPTGGGADSSQTGTSTADDPPSGGDDAQDRFRP